MNKELFKEKVYLKYEKEMNRKKSGTHKIFKMVAMIMITLLATTGVVFAGAKIYENYIKKEDEIASRGLFDRGDGITTYEIDLMVNDMIWNSEPKLYHKIITNIDDYHIYKERVNELPDLTDKDFEENFVVIIANENVRDFDEKDLHIYNVYAEKDTTYIILKQKENPDETNESNIWYAIVDKSQLRDNIKVEIEHRIPESEDFINIEELPENYSIEDAIKDGCFVENQNEVLSNNPNAIEEFMNKAERGENCFIRVYSKSNAFIKITDVEFENGIYYTYSDYSKSEIAYDRQSICKAYKYLVKKEADDLTRYIFTNDKPDIESWEGNPLVSIRY